MNIELTRREYRNLLDLLYLGEWIFNAHKVEEDPRTKKYKQIEQKIFALAKEVGYERLIEYFPEYDQYFPTRIWEESGLVESAIDEYNDETFWAELISRLAERDLVRQEGGYEKVRRMTIEELISKQTRLEVFYADEFEENGLENLHLADKVS